MKKYEVKDVVCDYGIFENGVLIPQLILNSKSNAAVIKEILDMDQQHKKYDELQVPVPYWLVSWFNLVDTEGERLDKFELIRQMTEATNAWHSGAHHNPNYHTDFKNADQIEYVAVNWEMLVTAVLNNSVFVVEETD